MNNVQRYTAIVCQVILSFIVVLRHRIIHSYLFDCHNYDSAIVFNETSISMKHRFTYAALAVPKVRFEINKNINGNGREPHLMH